MSKYEVHGYTTDYVNPLLTNNFIPECIVLRCTANTTVTRPIIDHIY